MIKRNFAEVFYALLTSKLPRESLVGRRFSIHRWDFLAQQLKVVGEFAESLYFNVNNVAFL